MVNIPHWRQCQWVMAALQKVQLSLYWTSYSCHGNRPSHVHYFVSATGYRADYSIQYWRRPIPGMTLHSRMTREGLVATAVDDWWSELVKRGLKLALSNTSSSTLFVRKIKLAFLLLKLNVVAQAHNLKWNGCGRPIPMTASLGKSEKGHASYSVINTSHLDRIDELLVGWFWIWWI